MHSLGKITEECKTIWPDSAHVKWSWWRFIWLKEYCKDGVSSVDRSGKPKIDIWAYRYTPWCGRLWWCSKWLGTHSTLFPFKAFFAALVACTVILFLALCCIVGFIKIFGWLFL